MASAAGRNVPHSASNSKTTLTEKIYMPEYYDYFLRSVEREIRHEGVLLSRIKRSIQGHKSQKGSRKGCPDEVNTLSHNTLTNPSPSLSRVRNNTAGRVRSPPASGKPGKRYKNSASGSLRATLKLKASSFSTEFPQKEGNTRCLSREISNILLNARPSMKADQSYLQPSLERFENHALSHKKSKTGVEMAVTGNRPQWGDFECYRNNAAILARKYY
jgi:hypothetical protein